MDPATQVRELVTPVLAAQGLEVFDALFSGGALRIFIDRPGGVDLDAVSAASTAVSRVLDEHDPMPGPYTLEVSSPGLERTLRRPEHFRRYVGTTVAVRTKAGVEGERREQGRLDDADDDGIVVAGRRLRYEEIDRARTVFEWGPPPRAARKKAAS